METFNDDDFDTKIKNAPVAIIQFSASWCAPCRQLSPVLKSLSQDGQFKDTLFMYADIEEAGINTASAMGIRSVPCTICFKKGIEVDRMLGFAGEAAVREFLSKNC
tara:strand:- start:1143 stop:1460 length:318 start_codon:yes stop_codon:yes gene_type:complete